MEKVNCLLCGGTMPADDLEVQVEHMLCWHKATSKEEAQQMAKDNFIDSYQKELLTVLPNGLQTIDRRENPRKNFEARLIVNPLNTADFHVGWIQNISIGGIRLKTEIQPSPFTKEEEVGFFSDKIAFTFVGKGRVIWTSDIQSEVGIKFTQLAEETRRPLEKFLRLLP
jgi:hypothetical protein